MCIANMGSRYLSISVCLLLHPATLFFREECSSGVGLSHILALDAFSQEL